MQVDGENVLVQTVVHALEHLVVFSIFRADGEVFLNTQNAVKTHVLCNLNGIGAPRSNHLATGTDEVTFQFLVLEKFCFSVKPAEFMYFILSELVIHIRGYHALLGSFEKEYHVYTLLYIFNFGCKGKEKCRKKRKKQQE